MWNGETFLIQRPYIISLLLYCESYPFCCTLGPNSMTKIDFWYFSGHVWELDVLFFYWIQPLEHWLTSSLQYTVIKQYQHFPALHNFITLRLFGTLSSPTQTLSRMVGFSLDSESLSLFPLCVCELTHTCARSLTCAHHYLPDSAKKTAHPCASQKNALDFWGIVFIKAGSGPACRPRSVNGNNFPVQESQLTCSCQALCSLQLCFPWNHR